MKPKRFAVWGFLFAGVLGVIAGLRDWFAPGFFSMSPRVPGTGDIIGHFVAAVAFFALAALSATLDMNPVNKK
ncbi:MAG: hypothetical protein AABM67_14290 [Acidobacteriota bacterium]